MVRNNATHVAEQLDVIRREPKKFICLNDNIDHRKKSAASIFWTCFPPSAFGVVPQKVPVRF